ncbi:Membrane protein [Salmonella enterica]|nr:Membrane protein [Salmonella enterica]
MDARFVQAHKEARWALWLTLCYLAAWLVADPLLSGGMVSGCLLTWRLAGNYRSAALVRDGLLIDAAGLYFAVLGDGEIHLSRYSAGG